jgi:hypothetical protein
MVTLGRVQCFGLGSGGDVHDTAASPVGVGAAEGLHVDVLTSDAAHDVRAGDEDPPIRRHDHNVGQRRSVSGAARGRAEHDRELRNASGGSDHRGEHEADRVQRLDPLG